MVLILDEPTVSKLANLDSIIADVEKALTQYSDKKTVMPPRYQLDRPGTPGTLRVMLATLPEPKAAGLKVLTGTAGKRAPNRTYFVVMLFDEDGSLLSIMSANRLTQLRTGAASAIATKHLARTDSKKIGLIGAGVQGLGQLEAITHILRIKSGYVHDVSNGQAQKAKATAQERFGVELDISKSADEVARQVDVLVTATTSNRPVFEASSVRPGAHINAIGSNMPSRREIDPTLLRRAKVFVDSIEQATKESGDLIEAISKDGYKVEEIRGELGEVIAGKKHGRTSRDDITLFKSVGIAVEDIAAAKSIYEQALRQGTGVELNL
jgi:alanine dehydrogenase